MIVPALGARHRRGRWSALDWAVTLAHHGVYAGTTNWAYALLDARAEP